MIFSSADLFQLSSRSLSSFSENEKSDFFKNFSALSVIFIKLAKPYFLFQPNNFIDFNIT